MQVIEFEAQLKNGMIQLPNIYTRWHEGNKVKVIVLDNDDAKKALSQGKQDINRHAGKIKLTQDPLEFKSRAFD